MRFGLFLSAVVVTIVPSTLPAQQRSGSYHTVSCVKLKSGKTFSDFRSWTAQVTHKLQQSYADSGRSSAWYLLSTVMPAGASTPCDFVTVTIYPGAPPAPLGPDDLSAGLKKAGLTMTAKEYVDQRNSVVQLQFSELWENVNALGTLQKGDYVVLNHMKVLNMTEWIAFEKKTWQPIAESMVKDGIMRGWFVNVPVFGGSDVKYQGSTVDVYPSWDALFKDPGITERFKQVHPGKDLNQTLDGAERLRSIGLRDVLTVEDAVAPAK